MTVQTPVLIIGAGPVGLTLALDLAWRDIDVTVVETRHAGELPSVKCNHVSARSMEVFRRLGIAGQIRDAGLPAGYPHDVAYRTTTTGIELARIRIPSRRDRAVATGGPGSDWPTPEPPHRINQIYLEPILFSAAQAHDRITILSRTAMEDLTQSGDQVVVRVRDLDTGSEMSIEAPFVVGCDGGTSRTRKLIGSSLQGDAVVQQVQSTFISAGSLLDRIQHEPAWGTFSLNPRRCGMVYAIDGKETWLIHNYLMPGETFESVDRAESIQQILGVDSEFTYETISIQDWVGRRLVADRFRSGRVFLCGDSAHIWVPFGGYGMNAGIADAVDLSWLLAAHLQGWADQAILDAYEAERLPITDQVSRFAMKHAHAVAEQRLTVPLSIEDSGPLADRLRASWGRAAYDLNVEQYCAAGLNFGYFYDNSPIIAYDDGQAPEYTMAAYAPSTVPGCRAPHAWLRDGRSLYDACGQGYSLLMLDPDSPVSGLVAAAAARGVPLTVVQVDSEQAAQAYDCKLVLCRPDGHIAWRGNKEPADPLDLLQHLTGGRAQSRRLTDPLAMTQHG
jgi:2-polyprenyl-6-methoxyphenol hydroxylase-like FAD-dependent oxidoreductase